MRRRRKRGAEVKLRHASRSSSGARRVFPERRRESHCARRGRGRARRRERRVHALERTPRRNAPCSATKRRSARRRPRCRGGAGARTHGSERPSTAWSAQEAPRPAPSSPGQPLVAIVSDRTSGSPRTSRRPRSSRMDVGRTGRDPRRRVPGHGEPRPRRIVLTRDRRPVRAAPAGAGDGNFTKVVQRVPVKIALEHRAGRRSTTARGHRLAVGLSVEVRLPSSEPVRSRSHRRGRATASTFARVLIIIAVMLAVMLEIIDTSIVNVALPSMMGNLGREPRREPTGSSPATSSRTSSSSR